MKNTKLLTKILIIVLILLCISIGTFAYYNNTLKEKDNNFNEPTTFEVKHKLDKISFEEMPYDTSFEAGNLFLRWDKEAEVCVLNSLDETVKINMDEANGCPKIVSIDDNNYMLILIESGDDIEFPKTNLITINDQGIELSREIIPGHIIPDYNLLAKRIAFYAENLLVDGALNEQKPKLFKYDLNLQTSKEYKLDLNLEPDERAFTYDVFNYQKYFIAFSKIRNITTDGIGEPLIDYFIVDKNGEIIYRDHLQEVKDIEYMVLLEDAFYIKTPIELVINENNEEVSLDSKYFKLSIDIFS